MRLINGSKLGNESLDGVPVEESWRLQHPFPGPEILLFVCEENNTRVKKRDKFVQDTLENGE